MQMMSAAIIAGLLVGVGASSVPHLPRLGVAEAAIAVPAAAATTPRENAASAKSSRLPKRS